MEDYLDKMKLTKYKVESFDISSKHGPIKVETKSIKNILIMKDYEENFMPILIVNVSMYYKDYYKLMDDVDKSSVTLKFSQYDVDKNTENPNKFLTPIITGKFRIIHDGLNPVNDKEFYGADESDDSEGQKDPRGESREVELVLFMEHHLNNYRKLLNVIFSGARVIDAIVHTMGYCGGLTGLVQTPDNKSSYGELLIPSNNLLGVIKYLQDEKGIYNKGLLAFLDFDLLYILDKEPCKVWRPNEIKEVTIYISDHGSSEGINHGTYINKGEEKILINLLPSDFEMINSGTVNKEVLGKEVLSINSANSNVGNFSSKLSGKGTKVYNNPHNNNYVINSLIHSLNESECKIMFTLKDVNYKALTPNKKFKIIFQNAKLNAKYGGTYRMVKLVCSFDKSETEEFSMISTLELRKIK